MVIDLCGFDWKAYQQNVAIRPEVGNVAGILEVRL